jgi:hypothetical protein
MTTSEACKILGDAAEIEGLPMLDFLGEVRLYPEEYTSVIRQAYHVFMSAGREFFAPL